MKSNRWIIDFKWFIDCGSSRRSPSERSISEQHFCMCPQFSHFMVLRVLLVLIFIARFYDYDIRPPSSGHLPSSSRPVKLRKPMTNDSNDNGKFEKKNFVEELTFYNSMALFFRLWQFSMRFPFIFSKVSGATSTSDCYNCANFACNEAHNQLWWQSTSLIDAH